MPWENKAPGIVSDPGNPKYEESRLKGFRIRQAVAGDYEIQEGMLVPKVGAGWRDYYPANRTALPVHLAKIQEGDTNGLLAFAREYGGLGFINILPFGVASVISRKISTVKELLDSKGFGPGTPEKERVARAREHVKNEREGLHKLSRVCGLPDMQIWEAWIKSGGGDPLPWVWAHVRTLRFCIDLGPYIENDEEERLASFLRKYPWSNQHGLWRTAPITDLAFQHQLLSPAWHKPNNLTFLQFAKYLRREIINKNIQNIRIALQPDGNSERSFFVSQSLIEMAYWHLQNHVLGGTIKQCERNGCGAYFIQKHGRERFCPEPKQSGSKNESRCAVLHRVLKFKASIPSTSNKSKLTAKNRR